ncbi:3346_t:CDS:2 [Paraglomus brasilianum]|uniref:3346_t:CDS:1 n=1 Tax=Paraglomus brasilianum TaxID=144538 RepID=A0A9N9FRE7_9GLOM|nr:3346_t:CDS:2 [Paraglomus brasilianum]
MSRVCSSLTVRDYPAKAMIFLNSENAHISSGYISIKDLKAFKALNIERELPPNYSHEEIVANINKLKYKLEHPGSKIDVNLYGSLRQALENINPSELTWRDPEANMSCAITNLFLVFFHHPRQLTEFRIIQEQPELDGQQAKKRTQREDQTRTQNYIQEEAPTGEDPAVFIRDLRQWCEASPNHNPNAGHQKIEFALMDYLNDNTGLANLGAINGLANNNALRAINANQFRGGNSSIRNTVPANNNAIAKTN